MPAYGQSGFFEHRKCMDALKKKCGHTSCNKCGQDARDKDCAKRPCAANADLRYFEIADVGQMRDIRAKQGADGPADKSDDPCRKSRPPARRIPQRRAVSPGIKSGARIPTPIIGRVVA